MLHRAWLPVGCPPGHRRTILGNEARAVGLRRATIHEHVMKVARAESHDELLTLG